MCVCVCVCKREREREKETVNKIVIIILFKEKIVQIKTNNKSMQEMNLKLTGILSFPQG